MNIDIEKSTKFRIGTKIVKNNGVQSTKLYNKSSLMKLTFYQTSLKKIAIIM